MIALYLYFSRFRMDYNRAISGGIILPALLFALLGAMLIYSATREKLNNKAKLPFLCTGIFLDLIAAVITILTLSGLGKYAVSLFAIVAALLLLVLAAVGLVLTHSNNTDNRSRISGKSIVFLLVIAAIVILIGILTILP